MDCWGDARLAWPQAEQVSHVSAKAYTRCWLSGGRGECSYGASRRTVGENLLALEAENEGVYCALDQRREVDCAGGVQQSWKALTEGEPPGAWLEVKPGNTMACALAPNREVTCFGRTDWFTSWPEGTYRTLAVGYKHGCGLRDDGSLHCWGAPTVSRAHLPPVGRFVQFDVNTNGGCAVDAEHRVTCWGEVEAPEPAIPMRKVEVEYKGGCGITLDEKIHCWGDPDLEAGIPEDLRHRPAS